MSDERPLEETTDLFIGKTIAAIDAECCNNVIFSFTDGTKVALHIDCSSNGLPFVETCTTCANRVAEPVDDHRTI